MWHFVKHAGLGRFKVLNMLKLAPTKLKANNNGLLKDVMLRNKVTDRFVS